MQLRYHEHVIRLLGLAPQFSPSALACIADSETKSGCKLPASVREWYSLAGVETALNDINEENSMVRLEGFLLDFEAAALNGDRTIEFFGADRCNTGYEAVVVLDGDDDPNVEEPCYDPVGPISV